MSEKKLSFCGLSSEMEQNARAVFEIVPLDLPSDIVVTVSSCSTGFRVERTKDGISLSYARKADFFRALTYLSRTAQTGETVCQAPSFGTLCYMADLSRNAVLNVDGAKRMIRLLASMGYDSMMLYTEETYELPDYPYFGHMRGRYTVAEMKELDDYADSFGIELIPCIQTLGHLTSALRWFCFKPVKDTPDILLAGEEQTYAMIDRMIQTVTSCFRSRRVHIGMDEAHALGLGKYLDLHGFRNRFEILSDHLARVKQICDGYGVKPMIWSDMYFRLYNHDNYYLKEGKLPDEILRCLPKGVDLVYWDYSHTDPALLDCMFENHMAFGCGVYFAGGVWKWNRFAPHGVYSDEVCDAQIAACLRHGCKDVILTGWSDDGAEASQFAGLPCMQRYAEYCYGVAQDPEEIDRHFAETFGISRKAFLTMDLPAEIYPWHNVSHANPDKYLLYNGVLGGLMDAHVPEGASEKYLNAAKVLLESADHPQFGYMFATLAALCHLLEKKCDLSLGLREAYKEGKKDVLRWYAEKEIPEIISRLDDFIVLLRRQWYKECKTFGFEMLEIRLGGQRENLRSAVARLKSYCSGEVDRIEELEQPVLPFVDNNPDGSVKLDVYAGRWYNIASVAKISG